MKYTPRTGNVAYLWKKRHEKFIDRLDVRRTAAKHDRDTFVPTSIQYRKQADGARVWTIQ